MEGSSLFRFGEGLGQWGLLPFRFGEGLGQ